MNKTDMAHYWWLGLLQGILLIFIGWLFLTSPAITFLALVSLLGLYWLICGGLDILLAIFNKTGDKSRGLELAAGVIGIIAGLIVINNPIISAVFAADFLVYLIAFVFLFSGAVKVFVGSMKSDGTKAKWSWGSLVVGMLYVLVGLMLLGGPLLAELSAVVMVLGLLTIFGGVAAVIASFIVKND